MSNSLQIASNNTAPLALPEDIALTDEYILGGVDARSQVYTQSQPTGGFAAGQKIRLEMPLECVDLRDSTLQFKITGTPAGGATFTRFQQDIKSIFKRIVIKFGSRTVLDTDSMGLLYNIIDKTYDVNYKLFNGKLMSGTDPVEANRNVDFLNADKRYAVKLGTGMRSFFDRVYPLNKLNIQLTIDLYLAPADEVIETDAPGATYVVNDVQFHYDTLVMSDAWNELYNKKVSESGGITYTYRTFKHLEDSVLLKAGNTNASKDLPFKYTAVLGLLHVMRAATTSDQTVSGKMNLFNFNNINGSRVKIGSSSYPTDEQVSGVDTFASFLDFFGLNYKGYVDAAEDWLTDSFINAVPLMKHPKEDRNILGAHQGINTSIGVSMIWNMNFAAPLAADQVSDFYALIENTIKFLPNGAIQFSE